MSKFADIKNRLKEPVRQNNHNDSHIIGIGMDKQMNITHDTSSQLAPWV